MKVARTTFNSCRNSRGEIFLPRMGIYASLLILCVLFFLSDYGSQLSKAGIVPANRLPITSIIACKGPTEFSVISLSRNDELAFSVLGVPPQVQASAIQAVSKRHGVELSASQLNELLSLPYLAIDIEQIPQLLSMPYNRRVQSPTLSKFKPLNETQLFECILASRYFNRQLFQRPTFISLRIDTEVKADKVMRLMGKLHANGFKIEYQNQIY